MPNEQGLKQVLSPESTQATKNSEDKRRRNEYNLSIDELDPTQIGNMEPAKPTLKDLQLSIEKILTWLNLTASADDIKDLVTKEDFKEMDIRLMAQNHEINQLKDNMRKMKVSLDTLQATMDGQIANNMATGGRPWGHEPGSTTRSTNMVARSVNTQRTENPQRRSLVIEGLGGESNDEMIVALIKTAAAIKVTIYASEVEQIVRMGRRDLNNKRPGPVLVTLSRAILRDSILRKKGGLIGTPDFQQVFINADEAIEV